MIIPPPTIISTVITAVTKIASLVGPMLAKYMPVVIEALGKHLPKVIQTLENISSLNDVLAPNETSELLGEKAMRADKRLEDFDNVNEYISYLQNEISIEKQELKEGGVDSFTRQIIGASILIKGLNDKLNTDISLSFLAKTAELNLDSGLILNVIRSYSANNLSTDEFTKYVSDDLDLTEANKHNEALISSYKSFAPDMDIERIEDAIMDLR